MSKGRHVQADRRTGWSRLLSPLVLIICGFLVTSAGTAFAYWSASGGGGASAKATTLGAGNQPVATVSGRDVSLSWGAFTNATSYTVARSNVAPQSLSTTLNGSCAGSPTGTSCSDTGVVENGTATTNWTYTDTPNVHNWTAGASPASAQVSIAGPMLSSTVTSFPVSGGTTSATVANYFDNEGATYCVDHDTTTCPAGSQTTPATATVPASGGTVTTSSLAIPAGLSVGPHTLYAKGSLGSDPSGLAFSVTKVTPTITTTASPASVAIGGSVDDQAMVSGGYNPTGTITWSLYANGSCTGSPVFTTSSGGTVSGNTTYTSGSYTTNALGTYTWKLSYSGDSNNNGVTACGGGGETLTVNQATPSLSTSASTNVSVGQSVTDTATLANGYNPTGTITYTLYGPSTTASCTTQVGSPVTSSVTGGNGQYTSPSITPTQAGTYWWIANYGGDTNNSATTNTCGATGESSVINKVTPNITTTASPSTVTVGGSVADQSVFSGGYSPTGTLTWSLYKGATCTGTAVFTTTSGGTVNGNNTYTSGSYTVPTANNSAGTYTWQVQYTGDANNNSIAAVCGGTGQTLTVNLALSPTGSSLTSGTVGTSYTQSVTASGGNGTYTYGATGLPAGLSINTSTGSITGTPTAGGTFSVTISVHDSASPQDTGSRVYSLTIAAPTITLSPTSLNAGTVGVSFSQSVTASGGTSPYTYSISVGSLPAGLSINSSTGAITGTPTAGGTFNFNVKAVDSSTGTGPYNGTQAYTLTINAPTITVSPSSLPNGTVSTAYGNQTLSASGGTSPYTFSVTTGSLPPGLALTSGVVSGTPTTSGTYTFTITATDSSTGTGPFTGSQSYTVIVAVATSTAGSHTLTIPAHVTSFAFTMAGAGGGGGNGGAAGGAGGTVSGTITIPNSASATTFTVIVGAAGSGGTGTAGGAGGASGTGCAAGGVGGGTSGPGGGGGGGSTCIYLSGAPAGTVVSVGGGGGGGGSFSGGTTAGAGGSGGGGPTTNPSTNTAGSGTTGGGAGGGGGKTQTTGTPQYTIANTGGSAGGSGATAGGTCSSGTCGAGGGGGAGGNKNVGGGGGGGGLASGGGGVAAGNGSNDTGGGGGGGSAYTGGTATISVSVSSASNGGGSAGGGAGASGTVGSVSFVGAGITLS